MTSRWSAVLCLVCAALSFSSLACSKDNPAFCCSTVDSCSLAGTSSLAVCDTAGSRPFCDDTGMFGPPHTCIPDPTAPACERTEDCATPQRPVCDTDDTSTCVGCSQASDCSRFPGRTMCNDTTGACVECTSPAHCTSPSAPVCGADGVCRGCESDAECASDVCDEAVGSCVAEDDIIYVDRAGQGTLCTRTMPCAAFSIAVPLLGGSRRWILAAAGDYSESIALDGKTVTIVGPGVSVRPGFDVPGVLVLNGSTVRLEGMRLYSAGGNANADGVRCAAPVSGNPSLALIGVRIESNVGFGVDATTCNVTIEHSTISGNTGGGVSISDGSFDITNTFITGNGANTPIGGVRLMNNATSSVFEFNTVADNVAATNVAKSLICTAVGTQRIANNIFHSGDPQQVSDNNCDLQFNVSNENLGGSSNITGSPMFIGGGNFHLMPGSEGVDDADPAATLSDDFDGDDRPQGSARDVGADEVRP